MIEGIAGNLASLLKVFSGYVSDQWQKKKALAFAGYATGILYNLASGYLVFAVVYCGFAVARHQAFMVALFVLYGAYTAMIAGVKRAYVAEIAPPELKGTLLGLQSTIVGIALLPASVITGLLWNSFGAVVPFLFGAALSLAATLILMVGMKTEHPPAPYGP